MYVRVLIISLPNLNTWLTIREFGFRLTYTSKRSSCTPHLLLRYLQQNKYKTNALEFRTKYIEKRTQVDTYSRRSDVEQTQKSNKT